MLAPARSRTGSGSTGASRYRWNIANCNPTAYGPGDTLVSETGDMKGPTGQGMKDLIAQDPGAYWLLLGPGVELRHTSYDLTAAAERIRATTYPQAGAFAAGD